MPGVQQLYAVMVLVLSEGSRFKIHGFLLLEALKFQQKHFRMMIDEGFCQTL